MEGNKYPEQVPCHVELFVFTLLQKERLRSRVKFVTETGPKKHWPAGTPPPPSNGSRRLDVIIL